MWISAVGMACPVGLTSAAACAAIRAGIDLRRELPFVDDRGEPIVGSVLERLPFELSATQRWTRLLTMALYDLVGKRPSPAYSTLPIVLAISNEPSTEPPDREALARELGEAIGLRLDPRLLVLVPEGSCGGHRALAWARSYLAQGYPACVVAAADSLIDARRLLALDEQRRLLTPDNSDGVTPGEAAACVLVETASRSGVAIRGLGFANEPALPSNDLPVRGDGLSAAIRGALDEAGLALDDMDMQLSDASGEAFAFKELTLATTRLLRRRKPDFPVWLVADQLGDVGAGAGLVGVVTAVEAFERNRAPGRRAIGLASNSSGGRSAIILDAQRS